jgi:iron complex outermembrane receptor protein
MKKLCILISSCVALILAPRGSAQTDPAPSSPTGEVVTLPTFTIQSSKDTSYRGREALSTTRIATDLADLPQSVTVFNRSFIDAVNPFNLSDLLNYAGGGQTGTLNWTSGRLIIRGFVSDGDFVDGFNPETASVVDMALYDRVEIIKGPSAIFNASSPPGGLVNKITKSPTSYNVRRLKLQVGRFDANRIELDLGGPIDAKGHLMYRLIAAEQYSDGYYDSTYLHRFVIAPMLTYQFSPDTQLTLKYFNIYTHFPSYNGVPLDPRTLKALDIPTSRNLSEDDPYNWRTDKISRATFEFTSRLSDFLVLRLAAMGSYETARRVESIATTWSDGSRSFIAYSGGTIPRSTTAEETNSPRHAVQNDYNFNFKTGPIANNLLVGAELASSPGSRWAYPGTSSPVDPFHITTPTVTVNFATPTTVTHNTATSAKMFAHETASFLSDRILVSGGLSRIRQANSQFNDLTNAYTQNEYSVYKNLKQYGLVVKPLKYVSVFYGYNEGFAANAPAGSVPVPPRLSQQKETGLKTNLLGDRLNVSVSYFEAKQTNNSVPSYPFNGTNILIPGAISRGFDGEFSFAATKNIYLMGSFADYKAKSPSQPSNAVFIQPGNGLIMSSLPVDNVAQQTFSLFGRYVFTAGALKGFDVSIGGEYQSKRAITDNANQTFFGYIPSRTLINAYLNYQVGKIRYSVNIDNLFNTNYIYSVRSVNLVLPGTPINIKAAVSYDF